MNTPISPSENLQIETKEDFKRYIKENPQNFIYWLTNNPPDPRLTEIAMRGIPLKLPPQSLLTKLKNIGYLLFTDPAKFYGKNYVTNRLKKNARNTAVISDLANLANNITAIPFIYYIFSDMQKMGIVLAAVLGLIIFLFTNALAVSSIGGKRIAVILLLLSHLLLTSVSGIGSELMLGQNQIATDYATELNDAYIKTLYEGKNKVIEEKKEEIERLREERNQLEKELNQMSSDNRNYHRIYADLNGTWGEREKDWKYVPRENLPLKQQIKRLELEFKTNYQQLNEEETLTNNKRKELGEIGFVKEFMPDRFDEGFNNKLHLRSGKEAIRIAFQSFFDDLFAFKFHTISSSFFFMGLSIITSIAALSLLTKLSFSDDLKRSNDPEIALLRDEVIDIIQQQLSKQC